MIPAKSSPDGDGHSAPVVCVSALRSGTFASCAMEDDCSIKIWRDDNLTRLAAGRPEAPESQQQPPKPAALADG